MSDPDRRQFLAWSACAAAHLALAQLPASAQPARVASGTGPRLRRIDLQADDPSALLSFYRDALELPTSSSGTKLAVEAGASTLRFAPGAGRPMYHFAFNIPENKLDAAIVWMEARAPLLIPSWQESPVIHFEALDAHAVYFNDPAGNIVEFIAHHSLDNATPGAFDSSDILYASEIGLVVNDFTSALQALAKAGLEPFVRAYEGFAAVGDPRGFFIVVRRDRVWLPTDDVRASIFRTQVAFEAETDLRVHIPDHPFEIVGRPG